MRHEVATGKAANMTQAGGFWIRGRQLRTADQVDLRLAVTTIMSVLASDNGCCGGLPNTQCMTNSIPPVDYFKGPLLPLACPTKSHSRMVPTPLHSPRSPRLILTFLSVLSQHVPNLLRKLGGADNDPSLLHSLAKRAKSSPSTEFIVFACLIPVLVLLSGVFAGLTLGYMSLDETQLNVLSISGTPSVPSLTRRVPTYPCHSLQKQYAAKIKPIRENGHLLLVTLLLANMIVNETLPIIFDPVLGGSAQSVVLSTILIVM